MSRLLEQLRRRKEDRGMMADLRCALVESKKHRAWLLAAAGNWTIVAASDRGDRRWSVAARGEVMAAGQRRD